MRPGIACGSVQVFGEVFCGSRLIGPVHGNDVKVRKVDTVVFGGDRVIVPLGDVTVEDLRDCFSRHVEVVCVHGGKVVGHRDGADVEGKLDSFSAVAALDCGFFFFGLECCVSTCELDTAAKELFPASAGADCLVCHGEVGKCAGCCRNPAVHGLLLGGGTCAGEGSRCACWGLAGAVT